MLKIIDLNISLSAQGEYVVLQNQGLITVSLRGWALCTDAYLAGSVEKMTDEMYIFTQDEPIKPYTRVVLFTGEGSPGWYGTVDGKQAYLEYWCRPSPVWSKAGQLNLLHVASSRKIAAWNESPELALA